MKTINSTRSTLTVITALLLVAQVSLPMAARAQNSYIGGSGKWETPGNWSGGAPSFSDSADLITNAGNNTVTINATTVTTPAVMTISNLIVSGNALSLNNAGSGVPLHVLNAATLSSGGLLAITNSVLNLDGVSVGVQPSLVIGATNTAAMTVLAGGVVNAATEVSIGQVAGSGGTLTLAGGNFNVANVLNINAFSSSTGSTVWVTGGNLAASGVYIGSDTVSQNDQLVLSNGTVNAGDLILGQGTAATGSMMMAGGMAIVDDEFIIGSSVNGGTGTLILDGGSLYVTNSSHVAVLTLDQGTLVLSNGATLVTDIFTNLSPNATFINLGGTLVVGAAAQIEQGAVTISGGTNTLGSTFTVASSANSTATVAVTGGSLVATNDTTTIGSNGNGTLTASNATVATAETDVGAGTNSQGMLLLLSGSAMSVSSNLTIGAGAGASAIANILGGTHVVTGVIGVGNAGAPNTGSGVGQVTIANASVTAKGVVLGSSLGGHGVMTIQSGATLHVLGGGCEACGLSFNDGILDGGTIDATNADMFAGQTHAGEFVSSNGVATVQSAFIGFDNVGSLTEVGGTLNVLSNLIVGTSVGATGIVTMTGGSIFVTNGVFAVGNGGSLLSTGGVGHVTLSNGVVEAASVLVGDNFGTDANLTVAGTSTVRSHGGLRGNGIRTTVVNGGTIEVVVGPSPSFEDPILHDRLVISYLADGKMIVSNGIVRTPGLVVAASAGNTGTLELPGGATSVYSNMTVGLVGCSSTGIVTVTGGSLYVTNGGTAVLEIRSGTFTLSAGTVVVDKLVITNACARLVHTGGTLIYNQLVLDPNLSAVGDGIPNGWKQQYGLDPFDPNLGGKDADGDGMSNLQEFLAGTDPTNSASTFRITNVARSNNNVAVTWMMGGNKTNALQFANGGNYTTNFTDLFIVTNTVGTVSNYLDVGGATNTPARYYRVRLVP